MHLYHLLLFVISITSTQAVASGPTQTPAPTFIPRNEISTTASPAPTGNFISTQYIIIAGQTNDRVTIPGKTITLALPTCVQTITPDKNGYLPPGTCGSLYPYYPSFVSAVAFTVIFGALTAAHIFLAANWKANYCWVIIMGAIWETLAFMFRTISTKHQQSSGIELIATIFILLAPLIINAHCYITLARLIQTFHPKKAIFHIRAHHLSVIFVALDIVAFAIQLTGGSYASRTDPQEKIFKGIHIYMGGIGIQQFFIVLFVGLAVKFHLEMKIIDHNTVVEDKGRWKKLLYAIYASLGFITIRIIFRLAQFTAGTESSSSPLVGKEAYLYVFEAAPMVFALSVFVAVHPGPVVEKKMPGIFDRLRAKLGKKKGNHKEEGSVNKGFRPDGAYFELQNSSGDFGRKV